MVRLGLKPSLRLASCWRVLVVNGGDGLRREAFVPTESTTGRSPRRAVAWCSAVSPSLMSSVLPAIRTRAAVKVVPSAVASSASRVQYSRAVNARISRSRSTTIRTATDWTRPAERPLRTFLLISGLSVYPTRRSTMRRVCWASTRWLSISRGFENASRMAPSVISLKVTRLVFDAGMWAASATCQAIASPSRSRSVARKTVVALLAAFSMAETCLRRSSGTT